MYVCMYVELGHTSTRSPSSPLSMATSSTSFRPSCFNTMLQLIRGMCAMWTQVRWKADAKGCVLSREKHRFWATRKNLIMLVHTANWNTVSNGFLHASSSAYGVLQGASKRAMQILRRFWLLPLRQRRSKPRWARRIWPPRSARHQRGPGQGWAGMFGSSWYFLTEAQAGILIVVTLHAQSVFGRITITYDDVNRYTKRPGSKPSCCAIN